MSNNKTVDPKRKLNLDKESVRNLVPTSGGQQTNVVGTSCTCDAAEQNQTNQQVTSCTCVHSAGCNG